MKKISKLLIISCFIMLISLLTGCMVDFEHYKNQKEVSVNDYKIGQSLNESDIRSIINKYKINQITTLEYGKDHRLSMFSQKIMDKFEDEDIKDLIPDKNEENYIKDKVRVCFLKILNYKNENSGMQMTINGQEQNSEPKEYNELILYHPGDMMIYESQDIFKASIQAELIKSATNSEIDKPLTESEFQGIAMIFSAIYPDIEVEYKENMTVGEWMIAFMQEVKTVYVDGKLSMFRIEPKFKAIKKSQK